MSDAINKIVERFRSSEIAQKALLSGAKSELVEARGALEDSGRKDTALYRSVVGQINRAEGGQGSKEDGVLVGEAFSCVADGVNYAFKIEELADTAFFRATRMPSEIRIDINSAHPFGQRMAEDSRWRTPPILALLSAWAHYEIELIHDTQRGRAQDMRADWSRVLRRLLSVDDGFDSPQSRG